MTSSPILVCGVSGHLGRRVVELLLEQQFGPIIATTRTPDVQRDLADRGVDVRFVDFDDPESITQAFIGARRILLISTNTLGRRVEQHRNAIVAAKQVGAEHLAYTSFSKANDSLLALIAADHAATEKILAESGLGYTSLRNAFYTEMLFASLPPAIASNQIVSMAGDGRIAYVSREDCARAAVAALVSDFQGERVLDIAGPEAINSDDLARIANEVFGTEIVAVQVTEDDFQRGLAAFGMSPQMAHIFVSIERGVAQGAMEIESHDFEQLTGEKPTSVTDFLFVNRDLFLESGRQNAST